MSTLEALFSFTTKVNGDLFTVRGNTVDEFITNLKSAAPAVGYAKSLQDVNQGVPSTVEQAVANLEAAGLEPTPVVPSIEEKTDKWGGVFQKGHPDMPKCEHGARIKAKKISKAGKPYTAFVCVNDSPFGNYRDGKCEVEYPTR